MSEQRLTVGVFRTVAEAQLVLERLAEQGVCATIADDGAPAVAGTPDAATAPPAPPAEANAPSSADDGAGVRAGDDAPPTTGTDAAPSPASAPRVRVEVAETDFVRAMRVLFPLPDVPAAPTVPAAASRLELAAPQFVPPPANCSSCGRPVDPQAGVCWACGAVQSLGSPPPPPGALLDALDWEVDFVPASPPPRARAPLPGPPLAADTLPPHPTSLRVEPAPSPGSAVPPQKNQPDLTARAAEQAIRRAWWAAVIGLFVCPGVAHLYSLGVLFVLGFWNQPLSRRAKWMYAGALMLDFLALAGVGWLIALV